MILSCLRCKISMPTNDREIMCHTRTTLINIHPEHHGEKVKFSFIDPLYKGSLTRGLKQRLREYPEYKAIIVFDPLLDGKYFYPILHLLLIFASFTNYCVIYKIASNTNCVKYSLPLTRYATLTTFLAQLPLF